MTAGQFVRSLDKSSQEPVNVIDLDGRKIGCTFEAPAFLKEVSLAHKLAKFIPPDKRPERVSNYVLLSQKGAVTNWHIDFSQTSVFYVVLAGVKEFFICEREKGVTDAYEDWKSMERPLVLFQRVQFCIFIFVLQSLFSPFQKSILRTPQHVGKTLCQSSADTRSGTNNARWNCTHGENSGNECGSWN